MRFAFSCIERTLPSIVNEVVDASAAAPLRGFQHTVWMRCLLFVDLCTTTTSHMGAASLGVERADTALTRHLRSESWSSTVHMPLFPDCALRVHSDTLVARLQKRFLQFTTFAC